CEAPRITNAEFKDIDGKPATAHYQVKDRALQDKFLYALLTSDSWSLEFEPIDEPDISEGIADSGMWKVLDLEGTGGERNANITGVLDKVTQSGYYKLITRYYDEYWNCRIFELPIWYDFEPPVIELVEAPGPGIYKKDHTVEVRVFDGFLGGRFNEEETSVNWIDAESWEIIPAEFEAFTSQDAGIYIYGNESFNGRYYLKVKVEDYAKNVLEEVLFKDGSPVEFCFDNSPPEATLNSDVEKKAKTVMFGYSGLKDDYSEITLFRYGISNTPEGEPATWIDIDPASASGAVTYPEASITEGKWYLSVLLEDSLGNRQIIRCPEVFDIDSTKPVGSISFERDYTNGFEVPLKLTVDELSGISNKTFNTILSSDSALLNEVSIDDADWKAIIYENGTAYYNWTLTDKADGEQSVFVRFMDDVGNISEIYSDSIILDRTAPTGVIAYDHGLMVPTNENIAATLTTDDENIILNNNNSNTYIFNRNGEFEFVISDKAGNRTRVRAEVNNIDKDPPEATVTYSHPRDQWTKESITAELNLEDDNGYVILGDGENTHIFNVNGEFLFRFSDDLGNEGSIKAEVRNIDKTTPVGSIISIGSDTAPVTVYLSVNEPVEVTNNNGSFRYVFEENGSFTFEFEDKAGNTGTAVAAADTINSAEEYLDVIYSDSGRLTNNDINVEYITFSDLSIITAPTVMEEVYEYAHEFTENGDDTVYIRVLSGVEEGVIRTVTGSVHNIDRIAPEAEVILSKTELTNQNVTAALLTYDDRGKTVLIENNNGFNTLEFMENGSFTFELMDEAGNIGYKTVTVSNIDKGAPEGVVEYIKDTDKSIITAKISFPEETGEVKI
ncbi:MAG TPA: Ig-like domain repeat protein, partial [Bacillota bacterium]|nr:Ig-like domain repeat protein [Bacillota bacterium]